MERSAGHSGPVSSLPGWTNGSSRRNPAPAEAQLLLWQPAGVSAHAGLGPAWDEQRGGGTSPRQRLLCGSEAGVSYARPRLRRDGRASARGEFSRAWGPVLLLRPLYQGEPWHQELLLALNGQITAGGPAGRVGESIAIIGMRESKLEVGEGSR